MADPVERRLAAILAADVVGYSRLMGKDEEGTLAALTVHRTDFIEPCISEHRGRVVNTTGDGLLAEFASVVDAVRCAVAFQEGMAERNVDTPEDRRMEFRIGVNLGDVIVQDDDVFGDGVNVAARLEGLAKPGAVVVSGSVHEQVKGKLDIALEDLGPQNVKNIGDPVHAFRVWAASSVISDQGGYKGPPLPDKPSIAVLPFENMSADSDQEYFSDGITEDIITELSRFRSLFVIARNSSFAFKGQAVDLAEICQKLGVQYIVEGSVRRSADRVRVTAQLIEGATGHHLWADRYDRVLEDIFVLQDELTQAIVSILPGRLEDADRQRAGSKRTSDMSAYDCVLLGNEPWKQLWLDGSDQARCHFQKAIDIDPQFARAYACLAWTYVNDIFYGFATGEALHDAESNIEKALSLDEADSWFHAVRGQVLFLQDRDSEAETALRRALTLNPNDADAAAFMANILVYLGDWEQALHWIVKAKRLNPFPPQPYHWWHAVALYSAKMYEEAIAAVSEIRPLDAWYWSFGLLAMCHAQMGRTDRAKGELDRFLATRRTVLEKRGHNLAEPTMELASSRAARYRIDRDREHFLEGLRKAGLPE